MKSTALHFGENTKNWLTGFSALMSTSLVTSGLACDQTWPYYTSVAIVTAHIAQQIYTLNINNPSDCAEKFLSNKYIGLIFFLGIVLGNLLKDPETKAEATQILDNLSATAQQINKNKQMI